MKIQAPRPLLWSASACVLLQLGSLHAETLTVTSLADSGDGTLRAAIAAAADDDIIEIPLSGNIGLLSPLVIDKPVAIRGPGSDQLKIRRAEGVAAKFGVFEIRTGGASISRVTITDGNRAEGGGIYRESSGTFVLEDCLLIGNRQEGEGKGGGAIALRGQGTTIIRRCVIRDNHVGVLSSQAGGGGIFLSAGSLLLEDSSVVKNSATIYGGGLYMVDASSADVRNCTFSGNLVSRYAGGIAVNAGSSLKVLSSTVTLNQGGGVNIISGGKISIGNCIVSANSVQDDISGGLSITSLGYNLIGKTYSLPRFTAPGDVVGVTNPLLAPLGYYGGSTLIHPPTFNSVHVIDKGKASLGGVTLTTDQYGNPRPLRAYWQDPAPGGDFSDIGAVELWEMSQSGGTVVVNTTDDSDDGVPGKLHCSLREALNYVNGLAAKDGRIIRFDPRVFGPGKPRREIALLTGLPALRDTRLEGPGAKYLTVRRAGVPAFSVLHVDGFERSFISGVTLENGNSTNGGGIYASTPITIEDCHVRGCIARLRGGGIFCKAGGLVMKRCTLSNNTSSDGGAGLSTSMAPSQIENSTFDGNRAVSGFGGGILASGQLTVTACTLTRGYAARAGGGIAAQLNSTGTMITLRNCIVSGNEHADVCGSGLHAAPGFVSGGYNLIGTLFYNPDFTNGINGDQVGVTDPKLGPLRNNGGPTPTLALLPGSPAIDQGRAFDLATDQRGLARTFDHPFVHGSPGGDETDVGAFEFQRLRLDDWRRQYFTAEQLASAIGQPEGDANASGIPNTLKHLFGIDPLQPMDAADQAALPKLSNNESEGRKYLVISYHRSGLYNGPEEVVEYSTDLVEWNPAPRYITSTGPVNPESFDQKVEVWVDMSGKQKAYLRVSVPE